jgi:endogenous inhibitor of DNA gyrase (YacG/DUF329 family)
MVCPTCGRKFQRNQTTTPPFCSERCQLIDLGRWLGEEIGLPYEGGEQTPDDHRSPADDD